jgi:hypothetical protein
MVSFILLTLLSSCEDEREYSNGTILGGDMRLCGCCGGLVIEIDDKTYRFFNDELPPGSINFETADVDFPLEVKVQWKLKKDGCMGDEILITKIKIPG